MILFGYFSFFYLLLSGSSNFHREDSNLEDTKKDIRNLWYVPFYYKKKVSHPVEKFFIEKLNTSIQEFNSLYGKKEKVKQEEILTFIDSFQNTILSTSNDGFSPSCWGPSLWNFLHIMSMNYPLNPSAQDKRIYQDFITSLGQVLPCKKCRENYNKNLTNIRYFDEDNDVYENRNTFSTFMFDLHNEVNRKLQKPILEEQDYKYEICRNKL